MSDEFVPQETPETAEHTPVPPEQTEPKAPPTLEFTKAKSKPFIVYVLVMFIAAFLLLLLSFLMQQRNHATIMNGLTSSMMNAESVTELKVQNQSLLDARKDLEEDLTQLESDCKLLQQNLATATQERDAVEWLRVIQNAYAARDFSTARALLEQFQASPLVNLLPKTSVVEGSPAPAETYGVLVEKLQ